MLRVRSFFLMGVDRRPTTVDRLYFFGGSEAKQCVVPQWVGYTKSFWATFVPEWHFYEGGSEAKNWVEKRLH